MAYTDTNRPLIDTAELDRLQRIVLEHRDRRRSMPHAAYAGPHRSALRGQGMELQDMRAYRPGDDIRHMDWRATARSGKPMTKVFIEERERSLFLIVDRRPSMMFGTRRELKAATAARVAALRAFSAVAEREAVAGVVLEDEPRYFHSARTVDGVLPLLQAAAAPPHRSSPRRGTVNRNGLAAFIARCAPRGASIWMISDFDDVAGADVALSKYLPPAPTACDLTAIHIVDRAEQKLEDTGRMRLISPATGQAVDVDTGRADLRVRYRAHMAERAARLRAQCRRHGAMLAVITNEGDTLRQLGRLL